MTDQTIGQKVKNLRLKKKVTQKQMAVKLGITQSYVSKVEAGVASPNLQFLKQLREKYRVNLNKIICHS